MRTNSPWTGFADTSSYNVLRGTSPGGENPVPIAATNTSAYTDINGLVSGTTYYCLVQPVDGSAAGCTSNEAAVTAP